MSDVRRRSTIYDKNDEVDMIVLEGIAEQNERQYQRLLAYAKNCDKVPG